MKQDDIYTVGAVRTLIGALLGSLSSLSTVQLGAASARETIARAGIAGEEIDQGFMGSFADASSVFYEISHEQLDDFAALSLSRAQEMVSSSGSADETVPVNVTLKKDTVSITHDEVPPKLDKSKIPNLRPAFSTEGRTTAANSSSISDGAATMTVVRGDNLSTQVVGPKAKIIGHTCYAAKPSEFCSAPALAIGKLLAQVDWTLRQVDLFGINEAFAVVPPIAAQHVGIPLEQLNVRGGARSLGHPIGVSGARILTTLIAFLAARGGGRGIAAICLAGGEALAVAIEVES